jgi:hypothetical protein
MTPAENPGSSHQMLGYPDQIQNGELDHECELVSHGIYCGDFSVWQTKEAERLKPGASEWRLLLQIDTDGRCPNVLG